MIYDCSLIDIEHFHIICACTTLLLNVKLRLRKINTIQQIVNNKRMFVFFILYCLSFVNGTVKINSNKFK